MNIIVVLLISFVIFVYLLPFLKLKEVVTFFINENF